MPFVHIKLNPDTITYTFDGEPKPNDNSVELVASVQQISRWKRAEELYSKYQHDIMKLYQQGCRAGLNKCKE